ncbi:MAG: LysR substrate-binding domain-containing protein, partial [Pseudomonadota bacterium]
DARFFRISASDYQASLIAPALARALNAAPLVDVDLRPSGDGVEAVRRGTVTLALITGSEPAAGFLPRHICTDPFCVLYDPGHGTAPDGLADFAARDFVQAAPSGLRGGAVDSALADHGLTRRVRVMAGPLTLAGRLVQGTAAMAVLPETLARMFVPLGLATAPLPLDIAPATTWLIRSQRPAGDIAVDWLVDRLAPQSLRGKA